MTIDSIGPSPIIFILPFLYWGLLIVSWIALYVRGAEARDLLFWGAIGVVIPILGPLAAICYAWRLRSRMKRDGPLAT